MIRHWLYSNRIARLQAMTHKAHVLWTYLNADPGNDRLIARLADLYADITELETKLNINPVNTVTL